MTPGGHQYRSTPRKHRYLSRLGIFSGNAGTRVLDRFPSGLSSTDYSANATRQRISCCTCVEIYDPGALQPRTTDSVQFRDLRQVSPWLAPGGFTTRLPRIYDPRDEQSTRFFVPGIAVRRAAQAPYGAKTNGGRTLTGGGLNGFGRIPGFFAVLH